MSERRSAAAFAHALARCMHAAPVQRRVRTREVDELEETQLGFGLGEAVLAHAVRVDDDHLAGLDLAHHARADGRQRGVLARDHPAAVEAAHMVSCHLYTSAERDAVTETVR